MKITFLGTGAPIHPTRNTVGLLVEAPDCKPLLIDTCGGFEITRALAKLGYKDDRLNELANVIITHGHGDHIGGAMALFIAVKDLQFYGHREALEATRTLLNVTYPHFGKAREHSVTYDEVSPNKSYTLSGFEVSFFEVVHRVPTYAVRVKRGDKILAFSADSLPCDALTECARNADLFICDAICAAADTYSDRSTQLMHPVATEAAQMANRAGAKSLALTHLLRYSTPEKMLTEARAIFGGPVTVPNDGDILTI